MQIIQCNGPDNEVQPGRLNIFQPFYIILVEIENPIHCLKPSLESIFKNIFHSYCYVRLMLREDWNDFFVNEM